MIRLLVYAMYVDTDLAPLCVLCTWGRGCLQVKLERDDDLTPDGWWLVVGVENRLLAIKKIGSVKRQQNIKLEFDIEDDSKLALYFMSDTWMGADQEYEIDLDDAKEEDDDDEEDAEMKEE